MVEAVIPIGVALATGFSILISRIHSRVHDLDTRVDGVELRVEQHMVRIENKLDRLANCDNR